MTEKALIFDPSYGTLNMGDTIIVESTLEQLSFILDDCFVIRVSTHQPLYHFHQVYGNNIYKKQLIDAKYKFVLGSNLLNKDLLITRKRPWNIHFLTSHLLKDVVLVGVGSNGLGKRDTYYTRLLYKKVLSDKIIHSVRDNETKAYVESLGLKALNTGCATMWDLTPSHCKEIPKDKASDVVFTLTDYAPNIELDTFLIETLLEEYENVYFWPQGSEDSLYLQSLPVDYNKIIQISSNLKSYQDVLNKGNIDVVGSRLHGGIFALKQKVRTIIVAVDHRAMNKKEDYNLPVINRQCIKDELRQTINSSFETMIKIDQERIDIWKGQFSNEQEEN